MKILKIVLCFITIICVVFSCFITSNAYSSTTTDGMTFTTFGGVPLNLYACSPTPQDGRYYNRVTKYYEHFNRYSDAIDGYPYLLTTQNPSSQNQPIPYVAFASSFTTDFYSNVSQIPGACLDLDTGLPIDQIIPDSIPHTGFIFDPRIVSDEDVLLCFTDLDYESFAMDRFNVYFDFILPDFGDHIDIESRFLVTFRVAERVEGDNGQIDLRWRTVSHDVNSLVDSGICNISYLGSFSSYDDINVSGCYSGMKDYDVFRSRIFYPRLMTQYMQYLDSYQTDFVCVKDIMIHPYIDIYTDRYPSLVYNYYYNDPETSNAIDSYSTELSAYSYRPETEGKASDICCINAGYDGPDPDTFGDYYDEMNWYNIVNYLGGDYVKNIEVVKLDDFNLVSWLGDTLGAVFDIEILPNVSISTMLYVVIGIGFLFIVLKMFAGG